MKDVTYKTQLTENDLSYTIKGCVFDVYNELGPGLFESVYEAALAYELREKGVTVKTQVALPVVIKKPS